MATETVIHPLKYRELELKARGFDVIREQEALRIRLSQLDQEKQAIVNELNKVHAAMTEQAMKQAAFEKAKQEEERRIAEEEKQKSVNIDVPKEDSTTIEVDDNNVDEELGYIEVDQPPIPKKVNIVSAHTLSEKK